jgi:hypothetical protein
MADKSFRSSLFKRIIDLGKANIADVDDLVRIWRVGSGDEKAISIADFVATVDIDLGSGGSTITQLIEDLELNKVPYTGATGDVDLGEFGMSAGFLKLDTTPTNTPTDQGTMYWDEDDNTVDIILNGYIMKVGEDLFYPVKNQTGSSIPKGTNVGFAGTLGMSGRLLITPYLANGANPTSRYMGVTAETIGNGEDGKVLWFGRIRGINTNAFNEGDILYASTSSAGAFQTTLPVAPNNIVEVAAVVTKSSTNGVIFVRPQFLVTPAGSNTEIQYNNSGAFGATSNFTWNNTIQGVGINTPPLTNYGLICGGQGTVEGLIGSYRNTNTVGFGTSFRMLMNNSLGNRVEYISFGGSIVTNTAGSHSGELQFFLANGGTLQRQMTINPNGVAISKTSLPVAGIALDIQEANLGVTRIVRLWNNENTNAGSGVEYRLNAGQLANARIGFADNADYRACIDSSTADDLQFKTGASLTTRLTISSAGLFNFGDANNFQLGTTTGTKIGTATSQKIGFWNATPIVQPTTAIAESAFVENSGGVNVNDDSTFDGYTLRQVVKALRDAGLLA